jgi:hypothetical protein
MDISMHLQFSDRVMSESVFISEEEWYSGVTAEEMDMMRCGIVELSAEDQQALLGLNL